MPTFLPTIILRHRKENIKKCTLRGLEKREDFYFITYPFRELPDLNNYFTLSLDGEVLTDKDKDLGIFLIDGTWKYADLIQRQTPSLRKRSLPPFFRTAYPRRQTHCSDPDRGLASIEALYIAFKILGKDAGSLLNHYHWKEQFLLLNSNWV